MSVVARSPTEQSRILTWIGLTRPGPGWLGRRVLSYSCFRVNPAVRSRFGRTPFWRGSRVKRTIVFGAALALVLAAATGALRRAEVRHYVVVADQAGAISYAHLSAAAKQRLTGHAVARGPAGAQGAQGTCRCSGSAGPCRCSGSGGGRRCSGRTRGRLAGDQGNTGATGPAGPRRRQRPGTVVRTRGLDPDPALIITQDNDTGGAAHGSSVYLTKNQVITSLSELVAAPGAGMTHGEYGIYDKNLNLVAQTADTPADFEVSHRPVGRAAADDPVHGARDRPLLLRRPVRGDRRRRPDDRQPAFSSAPALVNILPGGTPRSVHMGGLSALPASCS